MFKRSACRSNWNLEVLVFEEGGKPEIPEKNPRSKVITNNKLNPHETLSTGIERGSQMWEASAYPRNILKSSIKRIFLYSWNLTALHNLTEIMEPIGIWKNGD